MTAPPEEVVPEVEVGILPEFRGRNRFFRGVRNYPHQKKPPPTT